jgi:hypothetical protein
MEFGGESLMGFMARPWTSMRTLPVRQKLSSRSLKIGPRDSSSSLNLQNKVQRTDRVASPTTVSPKI